MKKPSFFIIGAPKCGTTSMASWLSEHPRLYMSPVKEPHYFNTDHIEHSITSLAEYESLFDKAPENSFAVGEASTNYLYSNKAVPNILQYNPNAKIIVMIRNPIDMAYSLHDYTYFGLTEDVKDFSAAWKLQDERAHGRYVPFRCKEPKFLLYGDRCRLGAQLQRLFERISSERVHLVVFDDLKNDPRNEYQRVLNFLGVEDDNRAHFIAHNPSKEKRSRFTGQVIKSLSNVKKSLKTSKGLGILDALYRMNTRVRQRQPMQPETRKMLIEYFRSDVELLEGIVGRDFSSWLEQSNRI